MSFQESQAQHKWKAQMNSSQELHGSSQPAGDSLSEVALADGGLSVIFPFCQILSTQPACDSLLEVTQADCGRSDPNNPPGLLG